MSAVNRDQLLERARREVPEVTAHEVKTQLDRRAHLVLPYPDFCGDLPDDLLHAHRC